MNDEKFQINTCMRKMIVSFKSILVVLTLCLICSNSYARLTTSSSCAYEIVTDTLPDNEKKKIQENEQQREIWEAEQVTAKEMEWYSREKNWLTMPQKQKKTPSKNKSEGDSNEQKTVVFGIRAGANLASLGLDSDADGECSMITSFHAGVNLDIRFNDNLYLNTALLLSQKGYKYKHFYDRERQETAMAQFVMLPVQLSLRFGIFQINAGPYIEYGVGGDIEYGRNDMHHGTFNYYEPLNYGITAGAGLLIGKHFYLGGNYEMGLSDYANRNIAISLGYNF